MDNAQCDRISAGLVHALQIFAQFVLQHREIELVYFNEQQEAPFFESFADNSWASRRVEKPIGCGDSRVAKSQIGNALNACDVPNDLVIQCA
ncbi:hypothetical protein AUR04nite_28480 [Glutamicibacter uratoxydans]|uniref:Uncharacterized protein n=1 Tax=Glutamicibacter uratoxydans TaxID=43667 RepID=A0A4Y4DQU9_GLUUR|nr:hypothetical protein AUR04nite_28480 [Glutamicibacter uratoxydans]